MTFIAAKGGLLFSCTNVSYGSKLQNLDNCSNVCNNSMTKGSQKVLSNRQHIERHHKCNSYYLLPI